MFKDAIVVVGGLALLDLVDSLNKKMAEAPSGDGARGGGGSGGGPMTLTALKY